MNLKHPLPILFCCLALVFTACSRKEQNTEPDCPFTDIGWDNTIDDVISAEGNDFSTYDSVYGGICYTYPKDFNDLKGTIKYMFNDKEQLMCVAWTYSSKDADELLLLYESIIASVNEAHGESGYSADHPGNYGNVWYLESGDIVLSTMITSDTKALQYAYLHPLVSNQNLDN